MEKLEKFTLNKWNSVILLFICEIFIITAYFISPFLSLLPFAIVLGLVSLYYSLFKGPLIWIMVMIFATGLDLWGRIFAGVTLFHLGWVMGILSTVFLLLTNNAAKIKLQYPISKPFFLFLLLASLSLIYTPNFGSGLYIIVQTFALYIFFVVVSNYIKTKNHFLLIIVILLGINIAQTLLLIYQLLFENVTYFAESTIQTAEGFRIYRPSGTFHDPNVLASYMIIGVIYSISYLVFNKINLFFKSFLIICIIISLVGIILTFSRSGWLALIFGIISILIFYPNKKIVFYWISAVALLVVSALILTPYGDLIIDRFSSIFDVMKDPSIRVRIALIKSSFYMFFDYPFTGVGFRGYPILYDFYLDPIVPQIQLYVKEPHTLWTTLLAELSIWGVVVVFVFFNKFFKESYVYAKKYFDDFSKSVLAAVFSMFVALNIIFLFYGFLFPQFNMFWLNFALFYAIKDNYLNEEV